MQEEEEIQIILTLKAIPKGAWQVGANSMLV